MFLWAVDFESDIALFRTAGLKATSYSKKYGVDYSRLHSYESQRSLESTEISVWSVAYSGTNHELGTQKGRLWLQSQKESDEEKQKIKDQSGTIFGYMRHRYFQDLRNIPNDRGMRLERSLSRQGLDEVLHAL